MNRSSLPLLLLLLVTAIVPHLEALEHTFVFDDQGVIVENRGVTGFDLREVWTSSYWPEKPTTSLYRPLTSTTYAVDWAIGGGDPRPFLVVNLLLHALTVLCLFRLFRRLFPERERLVWGASFLFAVHPIHVEAIVGIVGRAEILSALFTILSYEAWLRFELRERGRSIGRAALPPFLWLLALLSKEGAVALPVLLILHRIGLIEPRSPRPRVRSTDLLWPLALLCVLFLRAHALGALQAPQIPWVDNPLAHVDPLSRMLGASGVLARQLVQIVTARGFSADYSYAEIVPGARLFLAGIPVLFGLLFGLFLLIRRRNSGAVAWGFVFFGSFWLVTSNLLLAIGTAQADRLLYLPLAGLLVLTIAALSSIPSRETSRRFSLILLALLVARFGFASYARTPDWRDDGTLFASAVAEAPRSVKARANLAAVLLRDETPESAREVLLLLEPVHEEGQRFGPFVQREAKARMFLGEHEQARDLYWTALATGTDSTEVLIELGNIALMEEDGEEAFDLFRTAERIGKKPVHVAIGLASALSQLGRYAESAERWRQLVTSLPDSVPVRVACAWNLTEAGDRDQAIVLLREGIDGDGDPRLWDALARNWMNDPEQTRIAVDAARQAAALDPNDRYRTTLALALIADARPQEAVRIVETIQDPEFQEEIRSALAAGSP